MLTTVKGLGQTAVLVIEGAVNGDYSQFTDSTKVHNFLKNLPVGTYAELVNLIVDENEKLTKKLNSWKTPTDTEFFTQIRLEFDRVLDKDDIDTISGLLGYALKVNVNAEDEELSEPQIIVNDPKLKVCELVYDYDSSNTIRSHTHQLEAFQEFEDSMVDGSRLRTKTTRFGKAGTRAVYGLGVRIPVTITVQ